MSKMAASKLKVNEIFRSIQGESTWAGQPCTFVRLQGCPLRCHYCDTSYAFREGSTQTVEDVVQKVMDMGLPLVQITGGEPLVQGTAFDLIESLCDLNKTVLVETSGACDIIHCDSRAHIILDIKTPCSGAADSFLESNYECLSQMDEVKFVITNREDFDWAKELTLERGLQDVVKAVHFSPVMQQDRNADIQGAEQLDPSTLASWILEDAPWAKLQLQIHKYIWSPTLRGV